MILNSQSRGHGQPVILLHGLFGSLSNLGGLAAELSRSYQVYQYDLRNHGQSPHANQMDYPSLAGDVLETMYQQQLERAVILGHSMGGKVAMQLALDAPERVAALMVIDIAPVRYASSHHLIINALKAINTATLSSRQQADQQLAATVEDPVLRSFLLKNLYRNENRFSWRFNLEAIARDYDKIRDAPSIKQGRQYMGPCLFLRGGNSDYVLEEHRETILGLFPATQVKSLSGAGHWPHSEKPETFNRLVLNFLNSL